MWSIVIVHTKVFYAKTSGNSNFWHSNPSSIIGRSVRSTTIASVLQIPTTPTTPPIIPKKNHETSTSTVGTVQVADRPC